MPTARIRCISIVSPHTLITYRPFLNGMTECSSSKSSIVVGPKIEFEFDLCDALGGLKDPNSCITKLHSMAVEILAISCWIDGMLSMRS